MLEGAAKSHPATLRPGNVEMQWMEKSASREDGHIPSDKCIVLSCCEETKGCHSQGVIEAQRQREDKGIVAIPSRT